MLCATKWGRATKLHRPSCESAFARPTLSFAPFTYHACSLLQSNNDPGESSPNVHAILVEEATVRNVHVVFGSFDYEIIDEEEFLPPLDGFYRPTFDTFEIEQISRDVGPSAFQSSTCLRVQDRRTTTDDNVVTIEDFKCNFFDNIGIEVVGYTELTMQNIQLIGGWLGLHVRCGETDLEEADLSVDENTTITQPSAQITNITIINRIIRITVPFS